MLVVGAGKRIGRATAIVLGEAGAHTVVLDRHPECAAEVAEAIRSGGGRADVVCADVTVADEVERAIEEASLATGDLDIGVNITGPAPRPSLSRKSGPRRQIRYFLASRARGLFSLSTRRV